VPTLGVAEAIELVRTKGAVLSPPAFDETDVLELVEIPKRNGAHAELYVRKLWSSLVKRVGPGVSVVLLERVSEAWRISSGSTIDAASDSESDLRAALETLKGQQAHFRPKPVKAATRSRPKPGPIVTEAEGAGALASTRVIGEPRAARDQDVDEAERSLGTRFPAGYRTFVTRLGEGVYGTRVRVYLPSRVVRDLAGWRGRIEQHWFWGEKPLSQAHALECICFGDTIDGDELVFHASDPDAIVLLPHESEKARALGRGLAASLGKLVRARSPVFETTAR